MKFTYQDRLEIHFPSIPTPQVRWQLGADESTIERLRLFREEAAHRAGVRGMEEACGIA